MQIRFSDLHTLTRIAIIMKQMAFHTHTHVPGLHHLNAHTQKHVELYSYAKLYAHTPSIPILHRKEALYTARMFRLRKLLCGPTGCIDAKIPFLCNEEDYYYSSPSLGNTYRTTSFPIERSRYQRSSIDEWSIDRSSIDVHRFNPIKTNVVPNPA